jgi:two-component system, LuxR family, sensor kinase FixL
MSVPFQAIWDQRNRAAVLLVSLGMLLAIALFDWYTKTYLTLVKLYFFPIALSAGCLPRWSIVIIGIACSALAELFSSLGSTGSLFRLGFASLALCGCGLFVSELYRNRRLSLEAHDRVRTFIETSPAAIVAVNEQGIINLANRAASELLSHVNESVAGHSIDRFVPELKQALECKDLQFRTSMQCKAQRSNGESFLADVWFSTYQEGDAKKLAAIIADVSDQNGSVIGSETAQPELDRTPLNGREIEVLRLVLGGSSNREVAERLQMSNSAVKNTLRHLFTKAGVKNRSQLVRAALERYQDLL